jgi:uncharacterized protein (TIGR03067 family)
MNWLPAFAIALAVGAPSKEEPKKPAMPSIVGEWTCIKFVGGGLERTDLNELKEIGFAFTADGKFRGHFGKQQLEGTFKTDVAKVPAEFDLKHAGNDKAGLGLFKIDKDTLTLCFAEGGVARPDKLASPAGTRIMLITFTRVEKNKE